jgi:hypothetical protein
MSWDPPKNGNCSSPKPAVGAVWRPDAWPSTWRVVRLAGWRGADPAGGVDRVVKTECGSEGVTVWVAAFRG